MKKEDKYKFIELTKDNEQQYLNKVVDLENYVLQHMEKQGKIGQLFTTGEEGIHEYVESNSNHVMIAVDSETCDKVLSAAYITQGQVPFTYNDITKYFKYGSDYQEYIKSKYTPKEFEKNIKEVYIEKICAYRYARDCILQNDFSMDLKELYEDERNGLLLEKIEEERNNPENQFHEKSKIRENINIYMSQYMKKIKNDADRYEEFYWVDFNYLQNYYKKKDQKQTSHNVYDSTTNAYDKILEYQKYKIYDKKHCKDISNYYTANTENTIELDTYITHPDNREAGVARILVLEGLKKSINNVLKSSKSNKIFIVSTLHEDNLSSKYVSEFFGLKDYLFVNRRKGRDRQVHICGIERDKIPEYLEQMEKKIAVLYDYNPNNIEISDEEQIDIFKEQLEYEKQQLNRLTNVKKIEDGKKYEGYINVKKSKVEILQGKISNVQNKMNGDKQKDKKDNSENVDPEL